MDYGLEKGGTYIRKRTKGFTNGTEQYFFTNL